MRAIILAGGGGTRLWPLSREDFPKQFLHFGNGVSLLQKTVQRLLKAPFIQEIVIATNEHHLSLVKEHLKAVQGKVRILVEPQRKNTAPAIALSVKYLQEFCHVNGDEPILVLPSDHLIEPEAVFLHSLEQMKEVAREQWIITFGIRPTKPETGYGYIQIGKEQGPFTFEVARFVEKPNRETAETYLKDPHFYWNSGMFIFSPATFWLQLAKHAPSLGHLMAGSYADAYSQFAKAPDLSIDYAIMEKSTEILVCPLSLHWSDIGSWDSVYEVLEKDQNQNVKIGQVLDVDTKNSLIIGDKRLISTIGLEDMLIVETEDALFVSKKGESQRVKSLVQELVQKGRKESAIHKMQTHPWGLSHLLDEGKNYTIKKIQLWPGQQVVVRGQWIALGQSPEVEGQILSNPYAEVVEVLLVEDLCKSND